MYTYMPIHTSIHIPKQIYTYILVHSYMYTCLHIHIYTICVNTYIYIYTY